MPPKYITTLKRLPRQLNNGTYEVPLTQDKVSIIDACDSYLGYFNWTLFNGYVGRSTGRTGNRKCIKLQNLIMQCMIGRPLESHEEVDHIDLDRLNNKRDNLRLATRSQNMRNKKKPKTNTSGYKGVIYRKPDKHHKLGMWDAVISFNGKMKHIGRFNSPEEAHAAYCKVGLELFGEFFNSG